MKLTDFKALTFDCYGTLIDWESGMIEALKPLTSKASRSLSRNEILEAHARHESSQQIQTPAKVYRELWRPSIAAGRRMGHYGQLERLRSLWRFSEELAGVRRFRRALQYLKRHYKLVILSNVDNESFSASNEKLKIEFDAVYTAEDCGSYKPSSAISNTCSPSWKRSESISMITCTPGEHVP